MNIREALTREHSRKQINRIVSFIDDDEKKFAILVDLVLSGEETLSPRAAWAMSYCSERHPAMVRPYLAKLVDLLNKRVHDGVKRNIIRLLQYQSIPARLQGKLVKTLFDFLQSADEPIAIKAFSMTVLLHICREHPELKNELLLVIRDLMPYAGPGVRSRAKKVLKELNTL